MDWRDQKIAELEAQIEDLKCANDDLKRAAGIDAGFEGFPKLTPSEARILANLAIRGVRSHEAIYAAVYWDTRDPPVVNSISVHMVKLRRKLKSRGIQIITHFGRGYELPDASRQIVLAAMRDFEDRQTSQPRRVA